MKIACGTLQNLLSTVSRARSAISHSQSPCVRELLLEIALPEIGGRSEVNQVLGSLLMIPKKASAVYDKEICVTAERKVTRRTCTSLVPKL